MGRNTDQVAWPWGENRKRYFVNAYARGDLGRHCAHGSYVGRAAQGSDRSFTFCAIPPILFILSKDIRGMWS